MPAEGGADDNDEQGGDYVCGADTSNTDEPCQFPVSGPDQRCHNHPKDGSGPPEGTGSGDPGHSMGGGPGNVQEHVDDNAKPALTHGVYAVQDDPVGTLEYLEDNRPDAYDWVMDRWESYLVDAPFGPNTGKADDLLTACLWDFAVRVQTDIQVRDTLTTTQTRSADGGGTFTIEVEHPGNLPADRLARRSESLKKKLGVLDDPESAKAEAMEGGWGAAAREVAMRVDSEVNDPDDDEQGVIDHA